MIFWRGVALGTLVAYLVVLVVDGYGRAARRIAWPVVGFIILVSIFNRFRRAPESRNSVVHPEQDR